MPPKRDIIFGHIDGSQPTRQSSRNLRKDDTEVIMGHVNPPPVRQSSRSKQGTSTKAEVIMHAASEQSSDEDGLEGDTVDDEPQTKV
jgi:hypothetical protein